MKHVIDIVLGVALLYGGYMIGDFVSPILRAIFPNPTWQTHVMIIVGWLVLWIPYAVGWCTIAQVLRGDK